MFRFVYSLSPTGATDTSNTTVVTRFRLLVGELCHSVGQVVGSFTLEVRMLVFLGLRLFVGFLETSPKETCQRPPLTLDRL